MLPSCGPEFEQRVKDMARRLKTTDQILAWRVLMIDIEMPRARAVAEGKPDHNPDPFYVVDVDKFREWWQTHVVGQSDLKTKGAKR